MAKTFALLFVLGLMVSCASHHNDRTISSEEQQKDNGYRGFERFTR